MEARELPLVLEHPAAAPETRLVGLVEHNRIGILRAAEAPLGLGASPAGSSHDVAIEGGGTLEVGDHELDIAEFAVADHGGLFLERLKLSLPCGRRVSNSLRGLAPLHSMSPIRLDSRLCCEQRSREVTCRLERRCLPMT